MSGAATATDRPVPAVLVRGAAAVLIPLLLLSGVAMVAADVAGSGALVLRDAGALARHGAPVAAMLGDLAAAVMLGGAVLAGWLLREDADRARALTLVAVAGGVATLARGIGLLLSYSIATGQRVGSERFGSDLGVFVRTDLGIWLLTGVLVGALTTTLAVTGTGRGTGRLVTVAAGVLAFCAAMTGHAAGDTSHEVATSTMLVHLLAVGIWVGGLAVLQLLPARSRDDARVLAGYSHLALVCWVALGLSGVWALVVRMTSPAELLTSAYVQLGLAKAALLLGLGVLGWMQRRQLAASLAGGGDAAAARATYRRLALLELALMGLAVALAAAMSSSPPPSDEAAPPGGTAGILTGYELPAAPTAVAVLAAWRPSPFSLALVCVIALWWWRAGAPARGRGETLRLAAGAAVLILATNGPPAVYGKVLVSAHLLQHLLLLAPAGVLLGSAGTVPPRWRRFLASRAWLAPLLAAVPVAALVGIYATGLLRLALDAHAAHLALQMLALGGGVAIAVVLRCAPRPRLALLTPLVVLAAAGVVLLLGDTLLAASWFGATGRPWWPDALADQHRGGIVVLAWAVLGAAIGLPLARRR